MTETTLKILHKLDEMPLLEGEFAAMKLESAKAALGLLEDLIQLPKEMQKDLVIILAYLARKALLCAEEKNAIFGEHTIEAGLIKKILTDGRGCSTAIILLALEWVDRGRFPQAAELLMSIRYDEWAKIAAEWGSQWEISHSADAALVRLMASHCGDVSLEEREVEEMCRVVHEHHSAIDMLFGLISA